MNEILVRELTSLEDAEACEDLQVTIWPIHSGSAGYCIPIHLLISQMELGGVVLGAFIDSSMIGFLLAVCAQDDDKTPYHYSCLAGVLPKYRHKGIMEKLKWKHAEIAEHQGIKKIIWTFDPLQSPNANLNIRKLGGIVKIYKPNRYGIRAGGSPQNFGIPTDRFVLEWNPFESKERVLESEGLNLSDLIDSVKWPLVNTIQYKDRVPQIIEYDLSLSACRLLVEIPENFEVIRNYDPQKDLALDWRLKTREIFLTYFRRGYAVTDFVSLDEINFRRSFYLLEGPDFGVSELR